MPGLQPPERLTPADASNVVLDAHDQVNVFLMAGLLGPGGFVAPDGTADLAALREALAERLAEESLTSLRRFKQRVGRVGADLVWEACEPDLGWHVRAVGPVDGEDGLDALCGELMTAPLDLTRPLWELLIVPGAGMYPGVVVRVHHAVSDGVGVVGLVQQLFGQAPAPQPSRRSDESPRSRRTRPSLRVSIARVVSVFRRSVPRTVLLGPIGPRRGIRFVGVDLEGLATGARTAGATVNDALLAAATPAVEAVLTGAGARILQPLPVSVPVALPERGTSGNAVGVMLVPVPTGERDVRARLSAIAALTQAGKAEARAQGTLELTRSRWSSRLFAVLAKHQRFIAVFVTNVRGPAETLMIGGAPLERAWPVVPIQGNVRFGVAAFSYAGRLNCAVHVDADHLDAAVAVRTLGEELATIAALSPSLDTPANRRIP